MVKFKNSKVRHYGRRDKNNKNKYYRQYDKQFLNKNLLS